MMMERYRGDYCSEPPPYPPDPQTSYWSSDDPTAPYHQGNNNHNSNFDNYRGDFSDDAHRYHPQGHHIYNRNYNHEQHFHNNFNGEPNVSSCGGGEANYGSGQPFPLPGRKRRFSHSAFGSSPDCVDRGAFVKLYVRDVPRSATKEDIRSLFEEHGNIVEIVQLRDKRTGIQQECCFVKYATLEEADRAIGALHNQYTFPGGLVPIKVKYAEGEQERLGNGVLGKQECKVYVGCMNKQASKAEVHEMFSAYGIVEEVYLVRDEMKQNRGCGFIQFSRRDMAVAAINALNGIFFMRGCDQPLIVRFAERKKLKTGDSRCNSRFEPPGFGPRFREPVARPALQVGDPIVGNVLPNASAPPSPKNVAPCFQQGGTSGVITGSASASYLGNGLPSSLQQSPDTGSKPQTVSTTSTVSDLPIHSTVTSPALVPISTPMVDSLDCDWSEHTCPDGYKYYYNCISCESRWEKPEEYTFYEQQLQKQQQHPSQQLHRLSNPQVPSQQISLVQQETDHVQVPTSPVIAPACA